MNATAEAGWLLDQLVRAAGLQRLLRLAPALGTVLLAVLAHAAGGGFHPVLDGVALAVAVTAGLLPDGGAPLVLVLWLAGSWALVVGASTSGWVLAAALDLFAVHLACTLAGLGPATLALDRPLLRRWAGRYGGVGAATAVLWGVLRLLAGRHLPGGGWVLAAALLVVLGWLLVVTLRVHRGTGAGAR